MKENEKKTSDQDVELNLDEVGDKVVGGALKTFKRREVRRAIAHRVHLSQYEEKPAQLKEEEEASICYTGRKNYEIIGDLTMNLADE